MRSITRMITSAAIVAVGLLLAAASAGGGSAPAATMTAGFELPQGSTPLDAARVR